MLVKQELTKLGLHFVFVDLGEIEIMEDLSGDALEELRLALHNSGLELMDDKKAILIEKVKNVITEMIHNSDEALKVNYSDYISEKLNYDYTYLSNIFSEMKGITIQQFIIVHKIERVKELLLYDELSLTEISYKMHYSSVAHLSKQFKKVTGLSPSHYMQLKDKKRSPIEKIGNANDLLAENNSSPLRNEPELPYARSLIEASLDPLITINTGGKIMDMNQATVNITGLTRKELTGTDFFDYFTEPQKAREVYREVFSKGFVADYPLTIRDEKLTEVLFNGSVYRDETGNVLGVVVVARDVTEQRRIEKELNEAIIFAELATEIAEEAKRKAESATAVAEEAVRTKQQFLSNMSHEIRTPMNAIIGFTKILLRTGLTAKQEEYLGAIKLSGDALIVLINDILDLAKVDAGKMIFEQTAFNMRASIVSMLHLFEAKLQEKNLKLIREYDNKIPEVVLGDPIRLRQIILNLMSNAVKFTHQGQVTLSVRMISESEEQVVVEFSVKDTGIGIEEDKIEKIFEDFQQASRGTSRLYGGTGLGLAIVKHLVEAQNGKIHVSSLPGKGSTFSFTLNFLKTIDRKLPESDPTELKTGIKNIRLLVVEDIPLNQLLMKTLLDDFGFESEYASNGKIAIEMLSQANSEEKPRPYAAILMDLQMPEMDGFEATDYIRRIMGSTIPIIALSADVTTVDLAKCMEVGMNDYLTKPVDEKILFSKILTFVKNSQSPVKYSDTSYLATRTKSNPKMMSDMILLYLDQTPDLVTSMTKGLQDKDWSMLRAAVHKMIPSFSIMGIGGNCENIARQILEYSRQSEKIKELSVLVSELEVISTRACEELEEELIKIKL